MPYHVIYRKADGAMWQSFEADAPVPLPHGFSVPEGHAVVTFVGPPGPDAVWQPDTHAFVTQASPTLAARLAELTETLASAQRQLDALRGNL